MIGTYTNISFVRNEMVSRDINMPTWLKNVQLIAAKAADEMLNLSGIYAAFVLCTLKKCVSAEGH